MHSWLEISNLTRRSVVHYTRHVTYAASVTKIYEIKKKKKLSSYSLLKLIIVECVQHIVIIIIII